MSSSMATRAAICWAISQAPSYKDFRRVMLRNIDSYVTIIIYFHLLSQKKEKAEDLCAYQQEQDRSDFSASHCKLGSLNFSLSQSSLQIKRLTAKLQKVPLIYRYWNIKTYKIIKQLTKQFLNPRRWPYPLQPRQREALKNKGRYDGRTFESSIEAEAEACLSSRLVWSTEQVPEQPGTIQQTPVSNKTEGRRREGGMSWDSGLAAECLPSMREPGVWSPALHKPWVVRRNETQSSRLSSVQPGIKDTL